MADNRDLNDDQILVRCAWCERVKVAAEWVDADVEAMRLGHGHHSHGICPDCFAKLTPPDRP